MTFSDSLIRRALLVGFLVLVSADLGVSADLTTAFTYQGRLLKNGQPTNGQYDFLFKLYDAASGGSQVGSDVAVDDVTVSDGLFTVQLDFGNVFGGQRRWLEAAVRPGSSTGSYTTLSPRQELTASQMMCGPVFVDECEGTPYGQVMKVVLLVMGHISSKAFGGRMQLDAFRRIACESVGNDSDHFPDA